MNNWQVVYTKQAEQDLRDIYEYIAFALLEPAIAAKQAGRIMQAIAGLDNMPLRHSLYEKEPWYSKGLRMLPVDNFLVFYLPADEQKTVAVIRIMYGRRNIQPNFFS